jgi:hypothetical protein
MSRVGFPASTTTCARRGFDRFRPTSTVFAALLPPEQPPPERRRNGSLSYPAWCSWLSGRVSDGTVTLGSYVAFPWPSEVDNTPRVVDLIRRGEALRPRPGEDLGSAVEDSGLSTRGAPLPYRVTRPCWGGQPRRYLNLKVSTDLGPPRSAILDPPTWSREARGARLRPQSTRPDELPARPVPSSNPSCVTCTTTAGPAPRARQLAAFATNAATSALSKWNICARASLPFRTR